MPRAQEAEDLMDRGIKGSGQGFDAKSAGRLGAHGFIPTHNVPEHKRRDAMLKVREILRQLLDHALKLLRAYDALLRVANDDCAAYQYALIAICSASGTYLDMSTLQAAEARAKRQAVMVSGAQRLGGRADTVKRLTPAQVRFASLICEHSGCQCHVIACR